MKFLLCGVLLTLISVCSPALTIEFGLMWHDGAFAPFMCATDGHAAVGLMRNGTGAEDPGAFYLAWAELRGQNLAVMLGARLNVLVDESIGADCCWHFVGLECWPLCGWWTGWQGQETFGRVGNIATWLGEGWALWPMAGLGIVRSP